MTNSPPPFGPPKQPSQPTSGGDPTAGHSLGGLLLGLFIAALPAVILGALLIAFANLDVPPWLGIVASLLVAAVIPSGIFVLVSNRLKDGTAKQQAMRTAMRIIVFVAIGTYALGIVVVGACIAILAGAY